MTNTQQKLRAAVAKKAEVAVQEAQKPQRIKDLLADEQVRDRLINALPKGMDLDRFIAVSLTAVRVNPALHSCSAASLLAACMQAAQLGLEPGVLGHSYLVPFWNGRTGSYDVQLIIGYKGYIDLAYRSGKVRSIVAREVCENDEFDFHFGLEDHLRHRPAVNDRGKPILYYGIAKLEGGGHAMEVMNLEEIAARRARSKSSQNGPWVTDPVAMSRKTVIRQLATWLPQSVQLASALAVDESVPTELHRDMASEFAGRPIEIEAVEHTGTKNPDSPETPADQGEEDQSETSDESAAE